MKKVLFLFDIDGTLSESRKVMKQEMIDLLRKVKSKEIDIGVVGGSDLAKQKEQLGDFWNHFDYQFPENGLQYYKKGNLMKSTSMLEHIGENNMQKIINIILRHLSETVCPVKRGTFLEFRSGMLNVCPVGRSCSQLEREQFYEFDQKHKIRENLAKKFDEDFGKELKIKTSIGGQISLDVFPIGWDKTFCLQFVNDLYDEIHFFGDKTMEGGNDYEIYEDPRTIGHRVDCPETTMKIINDLITN